MLIFWLFVYFEEFWDELRSEGSRVVVLWWLNRAVEVTVFGRVWRVGIIYCIFYDALSIICIIFIIKWPVLEFKGWYDFGSLLCPVLSRPFFDYRPLFRVEVSILLLFIYNIPRVLLCYTSDNWWESITGVFFGVFRNVFWSISFHDISALMKIADWLTVLNVITCKGASVYCLSLGPLFRLYRLPSLLVLASTDSSNFRLELFHNLLKFSPLSLFFRKLLILLLQASHHVVCILFHLLFLLLVLCQLLVKKLNYWFKLRYLLFLLLKRFQ